MKRIVASFLIIISLLSVLSGCQPAATPKPTTQAIVVTNIWAAEILFALVDEDRITGVSAWCTDATLSSVAAQAATVPNRVKTGEPEGIVALNPDLVVIDSFSDVDGSLTQTLTEAGIKVLKMDSPTNFDQIKAAVTTLAAAVDEPAKGQAINAEIDQKLQAVADKLAALSEEQKMTTLYYDSSYQDAGMLCAYGAGSPFDAIATAAGLINVCDAPNYSSISKEMVVADWQPEVLVVPGIAYNADFTATEDHGASVIAEIMASDLLKTLPAVQNSRVFAVTAKYGSSTSQYMAIAVEELAAAAYPDLFK